MGETARILVQSPFETTEAWLLIERGNMIEQRVITLAGGGTCWTCRSAGVRAQRVRHRDDIKPASPESSSDPYADLRVGITELNVAPDQFDLM